MAEAYQVVDPTTYSGWDELVLSHPDSSIFHSAAWAEALRRAYGYSLHYVLSFEASRLRCALPVIEIRSLLTGRRGVSLPFSDYCDPLTADEGHVYDILPWLFEYGRSRGWDYAELRTTKAIPVGAAVSETYLRHELPLHPDPDKLLRTFRDSTVRNVKKAQKAGIEALVDNSASGMAEFFRLNCLTRREHGLPPQPYRFFELLHEILISKGRGTIVLAKKDATAIAGNLYLHFGDRAYYKYGASDKRFNDVRASNLVMWEGIRWHAMKEFRTLCFGKTALFHDGLRQFKMGWGTRESEIHYLKYDLGKGRYMVRPSRVRGFHNRFFRVMPIALSRSIGSVFYRHTG